MTSDTLDMARQVADAVLYEGYVLFPYRASALKNKYRWQWGVVVPQAQVEMGASEPHTVHCETLARAGAGATVDVTARFLQLRLRQIVNAEGECVDELEVDGRPIPTWEEGLEHEVTVRARLDESGTSTHRFCLDGGEETERLGEAGSAVRTTQPVDGELRVYVEALGDGIVKVRTAVHNATPWSRRRASRDETLRRSLVGVHVLLSIAGGTFASVIDPPEWAQSAAGECRSRGLHAVLIGAADNVAEPGSPKHAQDRLRRTGTVVLAAPIILYDHPQVAPESPGPSFDATEVDELLALAILGLTDEEKRRARATDERAAALIDRTDSLPPEVLGRLHGTVREVRPADLEPHPTADVPDEVRELLGVGEAPVRSVQLGEDTIEVGSRVVLRPRRRADAHDLFADGRVALVERIVVTVDEETYLAVTLEDDPAAELHRWYGRFQYFGIDEVEPLPVPEVQS
jgi:hypothetical protein